MDVVASEKLWESLSAACGVSIIFIVEKPWVKGLLFDFARHHVGGIEDRSYSKKLKVWALLAKYIEMERLREDFISRRKKKNLFFFRFLFFFFFP